MTRRAGASRPVFVRARLPLPAPVAQGIERSPPEREVAGSNPAGRMSRKESPPAAPQRSRGSGSAHRAALPSVRSSSKGRLMRRITSVLLVLGLLVGVGAAVAGAKAPGKAKPRAAEAHQRGLLPAAAAYLGVTPVALRTELRSGKSLAQVATAKGKSVDGLESALLNALRTRVQAARAAGKIDAARADRLLQRAPQLVERIVSATPRARTARARGARGGLLKVAATYLGMTNAQLATELRSGKSLAQVATAMNKSVDGLEQALLAALKQRVDAAVAAGETATPRARKV